MEEEIVASSDVPVTKVVKENIDASTYVSCEAALRNELRGMDVRSPSSTCAVPVDTCCSPSGDHSQNARSSSEASRSRRRHLRVAGLTSANRVIALDLPPLSGVKPCSSHSQSKILRISESWVSLDQGNPLHLHANDSNYAFIISVKLTGANQHMANSTKDMIDVVDVSNLKLTVGHPNGTLAKITHVGNLKLNNDVILFNVLVIHDYTVRVLGIGSEIGGLYLFDKKYNMSVVSNNSKFFAYHDSKEVWHCRLGHPANKVLKLLKGSLNLTNVDHDGPYEVYHKAKEIRNSFPLSENKSTVFGQLIHLDVWGPYKVVNRVGFRYFLNVVDDFSKSVWVYLLKTKDEVFGMFVSFYNLVFTQFNKKVKVIRCGNGTEFCNQKMNDFVQTMGIVHQTTCAYTPQ
ncbi:ribonuclease H-like domain-containing protein [Tanacetum coccineum]